MTSHDKKGDANRVACTNPGCKNGEKPGVMIPVPDPRPGVRRNATVMGAYMWTLRGLVDDAAVAAARCFVHKGEGYVPFPVLAASPQQGLRPSTDRRFQATPPSRPRSAEPSVQSAPRPAAPPRSGTGPGNRPQNAPRSVEPRVERPQAPSRKPARTQRPVAPAARMQQQAIRPAAPHAEAPVARSAARSAAPAARPVALPQRPAPRSDRAWSTFADLGMTGEVWVAFQAAKAANAPVPEAPAVVETKVASEPAGLESKPDTAPTEASELVVQDGPIVAYRSRKARAVVEPENFYGQVGRTSFFRRNKPVEHVLECGLEVAVGEMPEPRLIRTIEMRDEVPWLVLREGLGDPEPWSLQMLPAVNAIGRHLWGYYDPEDEQWRFRLGKGVYLKCVGWIQLDGPTLLTFEDGGLVEDGACDFEVPVEEETEDELLFGEAEEEIDDVRILDDAAAFRWIEQTFPEAQLEA